MSSIAQAASILVLRGGDSPDILTVERSRTLRFFGGFVAFPGGKVHPADAHGPIVPAAGAAAFANPGLVVAAARELFEETGILLARRPDGSIPPRNSEFDAWRRQLLDGSAAFNEQLNQARLSIAQNDFVPLGNLVTPAFSPIRFDTTFFIATLPPGQPPEAWSGEIERILWADAQALLESWRRGECLISPPTLSMLQTIEGKLASDIPGLLQQLLRRCDGEHVGPIYFSPEVELIPLRTEALPPSTHTNAYLVGRDPAYLIDPGPSDPEEQRRLLSLLEERKVAGVRLRAVLLSHHHRDHIGAAGVCAQHFGIPVRAHSWTASALKGRLALGDDIHDGERLDLGLSPSAQGPWYLEAIHTPGHAPGHLVFYEPSYRLLFAGDMVSTVSSVVIAPPEGDLARYLDSLERLQKLSLRLLLPGHGSVSSRPRQTIEEWLLHRAKREQMLLDLLAKGPHSAAELALELYKGVPDHLMHFAELQVRGGLEKLQSEGRVRSIKLERGECWQSGSRP
jgi:glyoxylase-like metal-dependent hydrolase (beta-lactamase superfamily II)/8-oxo-dGTP pyrophosphatase MutT (NUDIX family)